MLSEKLDDYFTAGTRAVWVIEAATRSVTIHVPGEDPVVVAEDEVLHGGLVLPDFACSVAELFEGLAPVSAG